MLKVKKGWSNTSKIILNYLQFKNSIKIRHSVFQQIIVSSRVSVPLLGKAHIYMVIQPQIYLF